MSAHYFPRMLPGTNQNNWQLINTHKTELEQTLGAKLYTVQLSNLGSNRLLICLAAAKSILNYQILAKLCTEGKQEPSHE